MLPENATKPLPTHSCMIRNDALAVCQVQSFWFAASIAYSLDHIFASLQTAWSLKACRMFRILICERSDLQLQP